MPGAIIMLLIGIGNYLGWHHLYLWSDEHITQHDEIIKGKSGFLNDHIYFLQLLSYCACGLFSVGRSRI
ncbi:MAG: hypothetical protein IPH57_03275 [Saprospiraceae bacterium]|nr:hypothetical protein [Saprospiraceae bacterium]